MANLIRLRATLSGAAVVGPGVSTFYSSSATSAGMPAAVLNFFSAIKAALPPDLTVTVPNSGDSIDSLTGALTGVWSTTGGGTVVGTGSGSYAQGVGCRVVWATAGVVGGRRVKGSTFIVPISSGNYTGSGALDDTFRTTVNTAATALVSAIPASMVVWSRPHTTRAGSFNAVTSASVPDAVSWLRSRRT